LLQALPYVVPSNLPSVQNVYWHLDHFGDYEIGRAVFHCDDRLVGQHDEGLFGPNRSTLSDLAIEAYIRLGGPRFLPNVAQLGTLIRAEHTVTYHCKGEYRKSGDEATEHPAGVYAAAVRLGIYDYEFLAAAKMHDLVEDITGFTGILLRENFGVRVARLVDGMTKYRQTNYADHRVKFLAITKMEPLLPVLKLLDVSQNLSTVLNVNDFPWRLRWLTKTLGPTRQILVEARSFLAGDPKAVTVFDYLFEQSMLTAAKMCRECERQQQLRLIFD